jgi:hypothetical protein
MFWCVWGMKQRHTIFHNRVSPVLIPTFLGIKGLVIVVVTVVGWAHCGYQKKHIETSYAKHVFLHPVPSACHIVYSGAQAPRNVDALLFMLGWARYSLHKKCIETRYVKLVFLHPVWSAGHVVDSGASGARNVDALFFMLGWAPCKCHKKHAGTCYTELMFSHALVWSVDNALHSRHEMSTHYFSCSCGPRAVSTKSMSGHVTSNLCFCIRWDLQVT